MKASPVFVPAFINVVTVGEDSGSLDTVLENLAIDYNKEINRYFINRFAMPINQFVSVVKLLLSMLLVKFEDFFILFEYLL